MEKSRLDVLLTLVEEAQDEAVLDESLVESLCEDEQEVAPELLEDQDVKQFLLDEGLIVEFTGVDTGKFKWIIRAGKKFKKAIRRIPPNIKAKLSRVAKRIMQRRKGKKLKATTKRKIKVGFKKRKTFGLQPGK